MFAVMSFQRVVINIKELKHIKGGAKPTTISYTLSLPTKVMEVHVVLLILR